MKFKQTLEITRTDTGYKCVFSSEWNSTPVTVFNKEYKFIDEVLRFVRDVFSESEVIALEIIRALVLRDGIHYEKETEI